MYYTVSDCCRLFYLTSVYYIYLLFDCHENYSKRHNTYNKLKMSI